MLIRFLLTGLVSILISAGGALPVLAGDNAAINDVLSAINSGRSTPVSLDKKLSAMASELSAAQGTPNTTIANKHGIYDMQFEVVRVQVSYLDLLKDMKLYQSVRKSNYVGIDVKKADDVYSITIIGVKRYVEFGNIKQAVRSDTCQIKGKWVDADSQPDDIVVIAPDNTDTTYSISGNEFSIPVKLTVPGKYMIEVNGKSSSRGPLSAATILVFKDIQPYYTYEEADDTDNTIDHWFSLINAERRKKNLAPLTLSKRLSQIAQAHSTDMGEHDFVAHVSPTTGDTVDRLHGISYIRLGENVALGGSVAFIHNGLMDSPAHRKNILGDYTSVGLGLYKKGNSYYATQVFIR